MNITRIPEPSLGELRAACLESHGVKDSIQVSAVTAKLIETDFHLESRGLIEVKGKGEMSTFLLQGHRESSG